MLNHSKLSYRMTVQENSLVHFLDRLTADKSKLKISPLQGKCINIASAASTDVLLVACRQMQVNLTAPGSHAKNGNTLPSPFKVSIIHDGVTALSHNPARYDRRVTMRAPSHFLLILCLYLGAAVLLPSPSIILQLPASNTSSALPGQSQHHEHVERISYLVPDSSTFIDLVLFVERPLPPVDVEIVLSAVEVQLTTRIAQQGDGPLEPDDDPYDFGVPECWYWTASARRDSLTYVDLKSSVQGLQTLLVDQQRFFVARWNLKDHGIWGRTFGTGALQIQKPSDRQLS